MLKPIKRQLIRCAKWSVAGAQFRRYTRPSPPAAPGQPLRIAVCFLVPLMGDAVMLFPLLDALAAEHPNAEIVGFVAGIGRILGLHPAVTRLHERPRRPAWLRRLWPIADVVSLWLWWFLRLRRERFHVSVLPRGGSDPFYSAHLAWLLGAPIRAGFSPRVEPERDYLDLGISPLLTHEITSVRGVHEIERGAEVLELAGLIHRPIEVNHPSASLRSITDGSEAQRFLAAHPQLQEPFFIISPGASVPRKEWPESNYAAIAKKIVRQGWLPVLVGGPEVNASADRIAASLPIPSLNLAGKTSFVELAAVCSRARCLLGNDSGTGHVAGILGTPSLIISSYPLSSPAVHQTSPNRTHPAGPFHVVVQPDRPLAPCTVECVAHQSHCITKITVDRVFEAYNALMRKAAVRRLPFPSFDL